MDQNRVVTFSYKPADKVARENVECLKNYSQKTGISFSYLVIKAIKKLIEQENINENYK